MSICIFEILVLIPLIWDSKLLWLVLFSAIEPCNSLYTSVIMGGLLVGSMLTAGLRDLVTLSVLGAVLSLFVTNSDITVQ